MSNFVNLLEHAKTVVGDHAVSATRAREIIDTTDCLVLDVQDSPDQTIPDALNVSLGTLPFKADVEMVDFKEPLLADRDKSKNIVVTCGLGGQALLAGKLLVEYGYENVYVIDGGNASWASAGCPLR
jgi:rhodanese-related sulfurtransferase